MSNDVCAIAVPAIASQERTPDTRMTVDNAIGGQVVQNYAFLRTYQPIEKVPEKSQGLLLNSSIAFLFLSILRRN